MALGSLLRVDRISIELSVNGPNLAIIKKQGNDTLIRNLLETMLLLIAEMGTYGACAKVLNFAF